MTLIDTGPLVALFNRKEKHHTWAAETLRRLPLPFVTCEPVLTEVFFLIAPLPGGPQRFFEFLDSGMLTTDFSVIAECQALWKLMHKYGDLPMSLADACLVRLAELNRGASVFTLDTHFRVYRKHGRQQIPVIMP